MLTSCVLRANKELMSEGLVYDIIANWDTIGIGLTGAKHPKEFKTSLTTLQNKYVKCDKEYCHSCRQDLVPLFLMIFFIIVINIICILQLMYESVL